MDALSKLLNKASLKDRYLLIELMRQLKDAEMRKLLDIKKLSGGEFYRVRKGIFRVIFHFEDKKIAVDAIRLRSEKTYRDIK